MKQLTCASLVYVSQVHRLDRVCDSCARFSRNRALRYCPDAEILVGAAFLAIETKVCQMRIVRNGGCVAERGQSDGSGGEDGGELHSCSRDFERGCLFAKADIEEKMKMPFVPQIE